MVWPDLIIFGPQMSCPTQEYLARIRQHLLNEPSFAPFLQSIKDLPDFWSRLTNFEPRLKRSPGLRVLTSLWTWMESGVLEVKGDEQLNVLLTPLTVIVHVVQYLQCVHRREDDQVPKPKVQGFCTGILAAAALACARDLDHLSKLASVSLRLSVCIGALVDLDGKYADVSDEASSIVAGWNGEDGKEKLLSILEEHPEAYISVIKSPTTVTITVAKSLVPVVSEKISDAGLRLRSIELEGRFHTQRYESVLESLSGLCNSTLDLQLPGSRELLVPLRSPLDGTIITNGLLHEIVLKSMLVDQCNWDLTITAAVADLSTHENRHVVNFSQIDCVPRGLVRDYDLRVQQWETLDEAAGGTGNPGADSQPKSLEFESSDHTPSPPENAIAIVGMACRFPGADSVEDFWNLLASDTSMVSQVPPRRFSTKGLRRTPAGTQYWGNFLSDAESFDHKFFKKSSREAASMDPQQRLALQVAYEAMESSGYFDQDIKSPKSVGVYLGVGSVDYQDNITSHMATAFSALGTLRSFISGKISHYFGWTGPSITYDTACSSSAVAIHSACKAIQYGECDSALAGGVNVITSPVLFQNLGAASFLSTTGASKAFDAAADGYCRGEGCGLVVLKKLSSVTSRDEVLAVIAGSAVNQSENCSPITVPHSPSQSNLYQQVATLSGISTSDVGYVEAHGTGTPVGDPIEATSIRQVFGGHQRRQKLWLGSVKGNIGHLEAASGAAALIKSILMIQKASIPKQASFVSLNPRIPALAPDKMEIATMTQAWDSDFKSVCINNYGAAGSNAVLIVCQPPPRPLASSAVLKPSSKELIAISANSAESLKLCCSSLQELINSHTRKEKETQDKLWLASLAFNLAHKQNHMLQHKFISSSRSSSDLWSQLEEVKMGTSESITNSQNTSRPVVLCFGGQTSMNVGLSRELYDTCSILRTHLDKCDDVCVSLGNPSIFPHIFSRQPIESTVQLHCSLFALQYSCARAWIDSGVLVDALIGHSFGQLTALCVAGVLSLRDSLTFIASRATLIQEHWGAEKGSMISVETTLEIVLKIISLASGKVVTPEVEIACHNGPKSFVLVGSDSAIDTVQMIIADPASNLGPIKVKKLQVTHGFHSRFVDTILPDLTEAAKDFVFHEAKIPIETCSEGQSWKTFDSKLMVEHSRKSVFFEAAVHRIEERLGPCIWLEAGSSSTITNMARKALGSPSLDSLHSFVPVQLNNNDAAEHILNTTISLRKAGVGAQYWSYHHSHRSQYQTINLPPYQFEKHRHWLDYKDLVEDVKLTQTSTSESRFEGFMRFIQYKDSSRSISEFEVNPLSRTFKACADGHAVLGNSLCPISLYIEIVANAINTQELSSESLLRIEDLNIHAPLGVDDARFCCLTLTRDNMGTNRWTFVLSSRLRNSSSQGRQHATGSAIISSQDDPTLLAERKRYRRLTGPQRCNTLLNDDSAESMQGALIYRIFGRVVHYQDYYRGVKTVAAKDGEVAGLVSMPASPSLFIGDTLCNPLALDNFLQVAGIHVNSLRDSGDNELFVCTSIRSSQVYADLSYAKSNEQSWLVYSNFETIHEKLLENDIFVFDSKSGALVIALLGVQFSKLLASAFERALSSVNASKSVHVSAKMKASSIAPTVKKTSTSKKETVAQPPLQLAKTDTLNTVKKLLSNILDMSVQDVKDSADLTDLGIDSLMTNEVLVDIKRKFGADIPLNDFQSLTTVLALSEYLQLKVNDAGSSSGSAYSLEDSGEPEMGLDMGTPASTPLFCPAAIPNGVPSEALAKLLSEHLEFPDPIPLDLNLSEAGLDSLLRIEVQSDLEKEFGVLLSLDQNLTFGSLLNMLSKQPPKTLLDPPQHIGPSNSTNPPTSQKLVSETPGISQQVGFQGVLASFEKVENDYERCAQITQQAGFYSQVYPRQARLATAYVVEAFERLGCPLASMKSGEHLNKIKYNPVHEQVMGQIYRILGDAGLIVSSPSGFTRTSKPTDTLPSSTQFQQLVVDFPKHASEHKLLDISGSKLAECLSGSVDPLHLIFGSKANKVLLEDVYTNAPMFATGTILLSEFLVELCGSKTGSGPLRILEVGAGTGGTTKAVLQTLTTLGVEFEYCFTDISASLVGSAKRKLSSQCPTMEFRVLDVEIDPPADLLGSFNLVISTNCIHATKKLVESTSHIRQMLRDDGVLCLLELTRNLFWFDLVFGLLDGWWRFEDGRSHALATETLWKKDLLSAGYTSVSWTKGTSQESEQLRLIIACNSKDEVLSSSPAMMETVSYGQEGATSLLVDVYYPAEADPVGLKRPVALMIHGGGHIMLSRRDIRPLQTKLLLDQGLLPVSIDYRLCPEVTLSEGPMSDACSALKWVREILPTISLKNKTIHADGNKVVAIGWSTGGQLAMSLAWTAPSKGIEPPTAILAFYCATDYSADFWKQPNIPKGTHGIADCYYNIWEGFEETPITQYNVPASRQPIGGWLSVSDPRSRIALHMNWAGQSIPILLGRMKTAQKGLSGKPMFEQPTTEEIDPINPRAQIEKGNYKTPTYMVHGTADDLIPFEQTKETYEKLVEMEVEAGVKIVEGEAHLFDLREGTDKKRLGVIEDGYEFLFRQLRRSK